MAAQTILTQQADGLATIRQLLSIKSEDIVALHETARSQLALTEEQQAKYDDAQVFMSKYDDALAEISKKNNQLNADIDAHQKTVDTFSDEVKRCTDSLDVREKAVAFKESQQTNTDKAQNDRDKQFGDKVAAFDDQCIKAQADLDKQASQNKVDAQDNTDEAARLADLKTSLDAKLAKLQEITSA